MVIPGNLPSQLRVLDSSQQLCAPLFLASCSNSNPHLFPSKFSKKLKKLLRSPQCCLLLLLSQSSHFSSFLSISDLPSQRSLLQPPFLPPFFCLASLQLPFLPSFRSPPFLSHSFCSFKILMATKDATRGPLGQRHLAKNVICKTNRERVTHA